MDANKLAMGNTVDLCIFIAINANTIAKIKSFREYAHNAIADRAIEQANPLRMPFVP